MLSCIVLASGKSKRLGFDKLAYIMNNKPVIEYLFDELNKIAFDEIIVVTNNEAIKKPQGFKFVKNPHCNLGISSSIKQGLINANINNDYMFFVGDQPLLKSFVIEKLIKNMKENKIVLPVAKGANKNPAIFPNKWRDELLKLNADVGGSYIIKNNQQDVIKVDFTEEHYFFDLDTINDLNLIRQTEFNK